MERLKLSGKKLEVAKMLATPERGITDKEIYQTVGISPTTFYKWISTDDKILRYAEKLIDKYTDKELGAVWRALIRECKKGDVRAIKLYFELKGKYRQSVETSMSAGDIQINISPASGAEVEHED